MTKQPHRPIPSLFVLSVSLIIIALFPLSIDGKEEEKRREEKLAHDNVTAGSLSPSSTEDEDPFLAGLKAYEQRWLDRINRNAHRNNRTANSSHSGREQGDEEVNEVAEEEGDKENWREGRKGSFFDWFKSDGQWKPLFVDKDCGTCLTVCILFVYSFIRLFTCL